MTPAASRVRSLAVRMSRDAPVLRAMASNLRLPKLISRMASIAHLSPTTWSALAMEQGLPGLEAVTFLGCHIQLTAASEQVVELPVLDGPHERCQFGGGADQRRAVGVAGYPDGDLSVIKPCQLEVVLLGIAVV